jgi:hypothetical protein
MKKIPTLFRRDQHFFVTPEVDPRCGWVLDGEGVATLKWDGTCCMVRNTVLYKRRTIKQGRRWPEGFELVEELPAGKVIGWVPVGDGPEDKVYWLPHEVPTDDGTYELVGPKINGNPEEMTEHLYIRHGAHELTMPRTFDGIRESLKKYNFEGFVFHHPDGRMAKIKKKDFGLPRRPRG